MRARIMLGATGVGLGLWGLWLLLSVLEPRALFHLPLWLGGAVVADDALLVPLIIVLSVVVTHHIVRTTLLYVGITTLLAIPLLLRQGKGANPTILPRDYLRDWLLLEAIIIATGAAVFLFQRFTFNRSRASSDDIGGR
ncbi:hypothetical protein HPO96_21860 [Kribbella sandramycini]|uniref:Uncharacterized protein n=1 Tax=Kribbella sandramycini TaxID=60450 RepID=A0A7Y4L3S1_9ACTN|nr:hypothetical protein [Kribbella sandramycini]MBB6566445.1 hypothetical protein [Kribbella sandramycini]NOL42896.1 hypothetical protein [Kribbella sandramycini]